LHVIPLRVPALRERKQDIKPLAEKFLANAAMEEGQEPKILTPEALAVLMQHDWPGNVRELKNIIERVVIMTPRREITAKDIPPLQFKDTGKEAALLNDNVSLNVISRSLKDAKLDFERQFILKKLEENGGNITKTAEAIGMERSHLHKKLRSMKLVGKD